MIIHTVQATLNSGASLVVHREENELHVKITDAVGSSEQTFEFDKNPLHKYLDFFDPEERLQAARVWNVLK